MEGYTPSPGLTVLFSPEAQSLFALPRTNLFKTGERQRLCVRSDQVCQRRAALAEVFLAPYPPHPRQTVGTLACFSHAKAVAVVSEPLYHQTHGIPECCGLEGPLK